MLKKNGKHDRHGEGSAPREEIPPPTTDPTPVYIVPQERPEVGTVRFETTDGEDNGAANYHVPHALRERVLLWRHQLHEQNHQLADGTWVYRLTSTSGVSPDEHDANLEPLAALPRAQHA